MDVLIQGLFLCLKKYAHKSSLLLAVIVLVHFLTRFYPKKLQQKKLKEDYYAVFHLLKYLSIADIVLKEFVCFLTFENSSVYLYFLLTFLHINLSLLSSILLNLILISKIINECFHFIRNSDLL